MTYLTITSKNSSASTARSPSSSAARASSAAHCATDRPGRRIRRRRRPQRRARPRARRGHRKARRRGRVSAGRRRPAAVDRQLAPRNAATSGQVDMLVNCAGTNSASPYERIPTTTGTTCSTANLTSTHLGCQIFGRHMAAQRPRRLDPQHRQRHVRPAALARVRLFGRESGRRQPDAKPGPRIRPEERPRERALPRLLSRRAKPQDPRRRARREHHGRHADGPLRRAARAGRLRPPAPLAPRRLRSSPAKTYYVDGGFTSMRF